MAISGSRFDPCTTHQHRDSIEQRREGMADLINSVPRDQYGVWCGHWKHIMVADPNDTSAHPGVIPADPWPCTECTLEEFNVEMVAEAQRYDEERWDEWRSMQ